METNKIGKASAPGKEAKHWKTGLYATAGSGRAEMSGRNGKDDLGLETVNAPGDG